MNNVPHSKYVTIYSTHNYKSTLDLELKKTLGKYFQDLSCATVLLIEAHCAFGEPLCMTALWKRS